MNLSSVFKISFIPLCVMALAMICGSLSMCGISEAESKELYEYFSAYFLSPVFADRNMVVNSLCKAFILWGVISASGAFLTGILFNQAVVAYKGFLSGYTAAGFCIIYGQKGLVLCCAFLPETVLFFTALAFFSAISLKMSVFRHEQKKIFLKRYIINVLIFLPIFCVVSILQTFLTTIFMNLISCIL